MNVRVSGDPVSRSARNRGMNETLVQQSTPRKAGAFLGARRPAPRHAQRTRRVDVVQAITVTMNAQESRENVVELMGRLLSAVAIDRDRAAFRSLFEFYAPRVKAFVQSRGTDPGMAEEVTQETMVRVWQKATQFDPAKASASTWVFTIARNVRIDMLRKSSRPSPDMNDPSLVPEPDIEVLQKISLEQEARQLRKTLSGLPDEQRKVLHLAFFEDKPHAEVANELGIPLGTVKSRIRLALKRIRSDLGETP